MQKYAKTIYDRLFPEIGVSAGPQGQPSVIVMQTLDKRFTELGLDLKDAQNGVDGLRRQWLILNDKLKARIGEAQGTFDVIMSYIQQKQKSEAKAKEIARERSELGGAIGLYSALARMLGADERSMEMIDRAVKVLPGIL